MPAKHSHMHSLGRSPVSRHQESKGHTHQVSQLGKGVCGGGKEGLPTAHTMHQPEPAPPPPPRLLHGARSRPGKGLEWKDSHSGWVIPFVYIVLSLQVSSRNKNCQHSEGMPQRDSSVGLCLWWY